MQTKSFFKKLTSKKSITYGLIGLGVVIAIFVFLSDGNGKQQVVIVKGDVVQTVSATGKVKPNQSVNLGFDQSGRVGRVYAYVGDRVAKGETIASLEAEEIGADISKAKASLQEEIAKLREIKTTAPVSYNDAYKNLESAVKESFVSADNAVRNRADQFFKNTSQNPQFEVSFTDGNFVHYFNVPSDTVIDINSNRIKVEEILIEWQKRLSTVNSSNVAAEASGAIENLRTISVFLDKVAEAINTFSPAEYAYQTNVTTYKTTISSARTEVSSAISDIVTAKDKLNSAGTLSQSGEFESVLVQEAKVSQARAALASLEASLGKSAIRAPFDGVITVQDVRLGSTVSAGTAVVSMISEDSMYIEANISEINIGKISLGNIATITFDAFPKEEFSGSVSYIEPGDFVIDGVVNYKIRANLDNMDPRIKSGLTANLKVQTSKKEGVTVIPLYAVVKEGDQNFVNKVINNKQQKTPISIGISGNDGLVEVLDGLNEGDLVEF